MNVLRHSLLFFSIILTISQSSIGAIKSTKVPRFDTAVSKAVGYLEANGAKTPETEKTLVAYALLKAGLSPTHPLIAEGIEIAKKRALTGGYHGYDHIYLSGVDAMLLADADSDLYFNELQQISNYVASVQRQDGSWSDSPQQPGDVSISQYGILTLWAAQRAGCEIRPDVIDRAAAFLLRGRNSDAGWPYRPGTKLGPGAGASTHNMTLAGAGSLAVVRTMLHGPKGLKAEVPLKFGLLEKVDSETEAGNRSGGAFPSYNPKNSVQALDEAVNRGIAWTDTRFTPVSRAEHKIYFYYALERASALADLKEGWFTTYGDGLLTLQGADGSFDTHQKFYVGTSFAILYFMRSTQQIIDKQFGKGSMTGSRGDLDDLYGDKKKIKKELGPLDELLGAMMTNVGDLDKLEDDLDDVIEKIQVSNREELVGQVDMLKKLLESRSADNRRTAYWALGRTGDFALIPLMMQGLRDPSVDCNLEALRSLRFIARKPNGFGLSLNPLTGAETADDERKVEVANQWRTKAYNIWGDWYRTVRPYKEGGGIDELELTSQGRAR
jgi:hypothetical protein